MKPELLHILQHSLGVDKYGRGNQFRNHFVTGPGSDDYPFCQELVQLGYMEGFVPLRVICGGNQGFLVTNEGKRAMLMESPTPPVLSRSKKRYLEWLRSDCGHTFGDWLRLKSRKIEASP